MRERLEPIVGVDHVEAELMKDGLPNASNQSVNSASVRRLAHEKKSEKKRGLATLTATITMLN
jgi:hypothetical protein